MSAGVSDQRMKGQGNQVINSTSKNVETDERFIPWSQQVDDAPFEPLPSPTEGSHSGCYESSSGGGTQFQYPPFKVKEGGAAWSGEAGISNKSSRRLSSSNDNYDNDGYGQSFGQQSSYNYFPKNGDYNNSWSSQQPPQQQQQMNNVPQQQQSRKSNNYDEYYRSDRGSYQNDNVKSVQRGMQNMGIDGGNDNRSSNSANTSAARTKSTGQTSAAPKPMTWASIASQPAKQPQRASRFTSSTSSTLKKKGPGMPPPPMVPGKHNMDIGTWDSPKNAPVLVPQPPPPVIPVPIMEPTPTNQNKNNPGLSNNGPQTSQASGGASSNNTQQNKQQGSNNQPHRNYNQSVSSGSSNNNNINMRPSWADQRDPPHIVKSLQASQYQRPSMNEERNNSSMRQSSRDDYHGGRQAIQQQQEHQQPQPTSPLPPAQISHPPPAPSPTLSNSSSNYPVLDELRDRNNYNPAEIDLENASNARFFVIKSYSEDDIHRSIKYAIWCSTEHGNKRLDQAYRERESENGIVNLFFSVNGSGHFCGMAQMMSAVDYNSVSSVWSQAKWKGTFKVKWIYVKDVPNGQFRQIRLENNENKSVTNSRDTQEVPNAKGVQVLKVLHVYKHITSIFDDFFHYEKRQEEEDSKKYEPPALQSPNHFEGPPNMSPPSKSHRGGSGDYERGYDKGYHSSGGGSGGGGGGGTGGGGGGYREKNYSRGGYHNYENRRQHDDHRGGAGGGSGYDRERFQRDGGGRDNDGGASGSSHYNNIRENSGGDYHNNRGFHRNEFRRDDRGNSGFNNRDRERDRDRDNYDGGFMSRGDNGGRGGGGGGFRGGDHYNRDRGDHNSRGRGRGVGNRN